MEYLALVENQLTLFTKTRASARVLNCLLVNFLKSEIQKQWQCKDWLTSPGCAFALLNNQNN